MQAQTQRRRWLRLILAVGVLATLTTLPAAVAEDGSFKVPDTSLDHLSQSVQVSYYVQHPTDAPKQLARGLAQIGQAPLRTTAPSCHYFPSNAKKGDFNC